MFRCTHTDHTDHTHRGICNKMGLTVAAANPVCLVVLFSKSDFSCTTFTALDLKKKTQICHFFSFPVKVVDHFYCTPHTWTCCKSTKIFLLVLLSYLYIHPRGNCDLMKIKTQPQGNLKVKKKKKKLEAENSGSAPQVSSWKVSSGKTNERGS